MSQYEKLRQRVRAIVIDSAGKSSAASTDILAEVLRTLETVTPPMTRAFHSELCDDGPDDQCIWLAMLRASPLSPLSPLKP
jgi:hypothetical protein